jgi:hypothetical protein
MERKLYITLDFDSDDFELVESSFAQALDGLFNALDNRIDIGYEVLDMETK